MIRFLVMIGVVYLVLKAGRLFLSALESSQPVERADGDMTRIDDVMVKDPCCQVYFPKRDGVHVRFRGEDLYFCSESCRDKFMAEHQ